jgi:Ni/Co efflux regulator RcnB
MKKLVILSAAALLAGYNLQAQNQEVAIRKNEKMLTRQEKSILQEKMADRKELKELKGQEVSYVAKEQLYRDFGDVSAAWRRETPYDIASFTKDGVLQSAYYDADAQLVGTTFQKNYADLPTKAKETIAKKYKGYTADAVIYFDDNEYNDTDMILYGQQFDDEANYFVELVKGTKKIVLKSNMAGDVSFFSNR